MRGNTNDRVVYSFTFQENEKTIKIKFYNRTNNIFCGSDHAASHRLRRSWALSILDNKSWTWINLPKHEYIDFLTHNDFFYKEFLLVKTSTSIKIFIR